MKHQSEEEYVQMDGGLAAQAPATVHASSGSTLSWWGAGLARLAIVLVVTLLGWYLLADPEVSPLDVYPLPFNAALFWALLFVVWSGFNLEFAGFARLAQPLRGIAIVTATAAFGIGMTWVLASGLGHFLPDFAGSREGGLGYFTGALFVLFAFAVYITTVVNFGHWPWTDLGLKQPMVGFCEIAFLAVPTLVLYLVLGLPLVSETFAPASSLMTIDTLLGWYYSIIVSVILTGLAWENWPWSLAGSRAKVVGLSLVGNVALGTLLYFLLLFITKVLVGSANADALGGAMNQFPSQLGVCWVAVMILWANAFGNKPTSHGAGVNLAARAAITLFLAVVLFLSYYHFLAEHVLHEPPVVGGLHGNALGFVDWFALVVLLYVVAFDSYGLPKSTEEVAAAGVDQ